MQANRVQHPRGGLAESRGGRTFDWFAREALGNKTSQATEVHKVGEFEAVSKGAAGGKNRVPQAHRADLDGQVNRSSGIHSSDSLAQPKDGR